MTLLIGELVKSAYFTGVGKLLSVDEVENSATVSFFESPENPNARLQTLGLDLLKRASLADETIIYCMHPLHKIWQRARYGGSRPNNLHLVIFRSGEDDVLPISDIYPINIGDQKHIDPRAFLAKRCCDTPIYLNHRSNFVNAYIEQRNSCKSISSVLSSGIELEAYQLAVVRKVLQDDIKKYLLADEVGLGKTIEAGMIIREFLLNDYSRKALIAVPESLIEQWTTELEQRFFLEALLDENIKICRHEDIENTLVALGCTPEIIVIDEAHLVAEKGWSKNASEKESYSLISEVCANSDVCLLLSGTPLNGNETNFLSMLHLLNPESYPLTEVGIKDFKLKIEERERLGGIYQALKPSNDNTTLTELLEKIPTIIPYDETLTKLIDTAAPLVDWLDGIEEGEDRTAAINEVRNYLGENYRLHQRMLRNRREDSYIASLFPGLKGVEILPWSIDEHNLSMEQHLDVFRNEHLVPNNPTVAITLENYHEWVSMALNNPALIGKRAIEVVGNASLEICNYERSLFEELAAISIQEQEEKDFIFTSYLEQWLLDNPNGKAVVFAGNADTARHAHGMLSVKFADALELHVPGQKIHFCHEKSIRILICDERGEDGLNLHGGVKLVVHYDLPRSISRIEQRLGRVNRYSADISASPIKSIVFRPHTENYSYYWLKLLDSEIGIFDQSVASLQYVLEPHLERAWENISSVGWRSFIDLADSFRGEEGLINREKIKIHAQEQLNSLESDILAATEYSERILESDEFAEMQADSMQGWITKGLLFRRKSGEQASTFRYQYQTGTLMDCNTFISNCLLGIDFENSTSKAPVTHLMSFDRSICCQGNNIHPFRYGQPFLKTIYDSLNNDSRGICAAQVRVLNSGNPQDPVACFKLEWFLSVSCDNQIGGDEIYAPNIIKQWLNPSGALIEAQALINLLEKPYSKTGEYGYKDVNLRPERWEHIEEYFPKSSWEDLVNSIYQRGYKRVTDGLDRSERDLVSVNCIAFSVIIIS